MWLRKTYWKISRLPSYWGRFGAFSQFLARMAPTLQPSVLVLSFPRSGSSWVGEILGRASNALYLREPVTQSYLSLKKGGEVVIPVNPDEPPPGYLRAASLAFSGVPAFKDHICRYPRQLLYHKRPQRRVVIKEVNPLACRWFQDNFSPRIIFLVRHPAGVYASWQKMGWLKTGAQACRDFGYLQANVLKTTFETLKSYPDHQVYIYEDICLQPVNQYERMFQFTGLAWDDQIRARIQQSSSGGNHSDPWGTARNSASMVKGWQNSMSSSDLNELRQGYCEFELPWFQSVDDW